VLPNGRFQVVLDLAAGAGAVSGVRSQYLVIDPAAIQSVMGVVFRPGGARNFFDAPSGDFFNRVVPLDLVWDSQATRLWDCLREAPTAREKFRLLESTLLQMNERGANRGLPMHPSVGYALDEFQGAPHIRSVIGVAREAGLSRRRFSQLFREQVGVTPKLYCRLRRFLGVVRRIASGETVDWADVAVAGGYCDQAHLIHEFQDFAGLTPGAYLAAERPSLNHVRIL